MRLSKEICSHSKQEPQGEAMGGTIDIFQSKTQTNTQLTSSTIRIRTYVDLPLVPKQATHQSKAVAHRRIRGRRQCSARAVALSNQSQGFHCQARAGMSGCFVVVNSKCDASRVVLPPTPGTLDAFPFDRTSCGILTAAEEMWERGHASKGP